MAEEGLVPVTARREALASRLLAKGLALPADDPLRKVAEAAPATRLKNTTAWRTVGREVWAAAGVTGPIEPIVAHRATPWTRVVGITFDLGVGPLPVGAAPETKKRAAEQHLAALPQDAT